MKHISFAIIFPILLAGMISPLNAATLLHYDFEDGTAGAPMNSTPLTGQVGSADLSGNGHHMLAWDVTYGPSFSAQGDTPSGQGLSCRYNGSQDGYTTTSINDWSPSTWTIELAFKLDSTSGWQTLIGRDGWAEVDGENIDSDAAFYLQKNDIDGAVRVNFATVSGERCKLDSTLVPEAGRWYYFAAACDGSQVQMYADRLDGTGYQPAGTFDLEPGVDHALLATGNWTFGRGWWGGNFTDRIAGNIDDIRFSDTVLSIPQLLGYRPVVFSETAGKTLLYRGDTMYTDTYEVSLLAAPTSNVVITVTPPAGIDAGSGSGQNHTLTFTPQNWQQPQAVTLRIGDPQAALDDMVSIGHTCQSADASYDQLALSEITVHIVDESCGIWGYLETDYNFDCKVNLEDFSILANLWLTTDVPLNLQQMAQHWLAATLEYDQALYAQSMHPSEQPLYVNTAVVENTIDEKVYGHFFEHIYHSANGGLWGELVWNRSFEMAGSGGLWVIDGTDLVQASTATDVTLPFGDASWQNYEMTLQAKKTDGSEGFLILFRSADDNNFYWLNLGGWNNAQHAVEKEVNGTRSTVSGTAVSGSIETGQWYDIRIRCQEGNYTIDLNDSTIISFTDDSAHQSGRVGVGTWATQARFRNIQVTRIEDSSTLFSGLPALPSGSPADFWTLHGPAQASVSTDALNDEYSVLLTASASGGIEQADFKFIAQPYTGSLWMKGSAPEGVKVELLDGSTVLGQAILSAPTSTWTEYPFQVTSAGATDSGSLRITLQGAGTVHLDQVSLLGQDALDTGGFRPDLLEAVEGLRPPVIRWPGGCYASAYFWKDGIGPQHQRAKYPISLWDDQDTNSYGTDEFLRMCERIDAEPLICINTGLLTGTCGVAIPYRLSEEQYVQDALDWMEYCNGDVTTYWGAQRAANGHPEPYNVRLWEIDNETWSTSWGGGIGNYIAKVQLFAPALQAKADELGFAIELIAVGGSSYDMSWNRSLIDTCGPLIDYISVHHYEGADGYKTGPINYDNFLTTLADYIAGSDNPDLKIYNSEWNLQTTDWRTGLYAGGILNVYERHGAHFKIGGPALFLRHTSATGWDNAFINFDHTGWFAAPNYIVMKLWWDHFAPNRVRTEGGDGGLNIVSTLTDDARTLYLRVVNPDDVERTVEVEIDASFVPESAFMHYVAPGSLYARNTLDSPSDVCVQAKVVGFKGQVLRFKVPALSAGVVTVTTAQPHKSRYLYSSFRDNGQDGLHLAYSEDGLSWTALKNDQSFLAPQIGGGLMRDPSICQGPDGMFHLVWTTGWWDNGIGIAHSADLVNWSEQTFLPVMAHEPDAKNCWAPEIFYDEATQNFLIYWSTTIDGAFPETYNPDDDNNHRIYYVSTRDFVTYSPTQLLYDPGFNCIDAFIAREGDQYVMFIKHESKAPTVEKNIRIAYSDHAEGPWAPASASISPAWVEGPSALRVGRQWVLYYDGYTRGRMEGQTSTDLETWTDITGQLAFPSGTRHGTVFAVTTDVLEPLLAL